MRRQSDLNDIYGVKGIRNPLDKDSDAPETGFRHSDAYHRFFRGYTEIRREKPNGRYAVERYYTQPWIVNAASRQVYWLNRTLYAFLLFLCWMLYIHAMTMDLGSNRAWFVAIAGMIALIALMLLTVVATIYIFMRKKMTLWDHASSTKRLKALSLITASAMALTAVTKGVYWVRCGKNAGEWQSIAMMLLAAAAAATVCFLERQVVYATIPNDTVLPEGEAHEIW